MNTQSDVEPVRKKLRLDTSSSPESVKSALKTKSPNTAREGDQNKATWEEGPFTGVTIMDRVYNSEDSQKKPAETEKPVRSSPPGKLGVRKSLEASQPGQTRSQVARRGKSFLQQRHRNSLEGWLMKRPSLSSEPQTLPAITEPKAQMDADMMGPESPDVPILQSAACEDREEVPQNQSQNTGNAAVSSAKSVDTTAWTESLTEGDPDELDRAGEDVMMETQSSPESGKPEQSSTGQKGHTPGTKITDYFCKPLSVIPSTRYVCCKPYIQ